MLEDQYGRNPWWANLLALILFPIIWICEAWAWLTKGWNKDLDDKEHEQ